MESSIVDMHSDILRRCRKGDRNAQMQLYNLYYKAMYNTSLRIVNNTFEAEDVMQESFLAAFQKLGELQEDQTFAAWLKRIVVNKSINALQKNQRFDLEAEVPVEDDDSLDHEEVAMTVDKVKAAMTELPDGYRTVLTLYLFEGYDHEEISTITGLSSATSRSQYNRGKKLLKKIILQN